MIFDIFSKYGNVIKVVIFYKNKCYKAFIEMDSITSATKAKEQLDE
jgi:hypothetical protein